MELFSIIENLGKWENAGNQRSIFLFIVVFNPLPDDNF